MTQRFEFFEKFEIVCNFANSFRAPSRVVRATVRVPCFYSIYWIVPYFVLKVHIKHFNIDYVYFSIAVSALFTVSKPHTVMVQRFYLKVEHCFKTLPMSFHQQIFCSKKLPYFANWGCPSVKFVFNASTVDAGSVSQTIRTFFENISGYNFAF